MPPDRTPPSFRGFFFGQFPCLIHNPIHHDNIIAPPQSSVLPQFTNSSCNSTREQQRMTAFTIMTMLLLLHHLSLKFANDEEEERSLKFSDSSANRNSSLGKANYCDHHLCHHHIRKSLMMMMAICKAQQCLHAQHAHSAI